VKNNTVVKTFFFIVLIFKMEHNKQIQASVKFPPNHPRQKFREEKNFKEKRFNILPKNLCEKYFLVILQKYASINDKTRNRPEFQ
jgi:hypothetical protein